MVISAGGVPVFCDVEKKSITIDLNSIKKLIHNIDSKIKFRKNIAIKELNYRNQLIYVSKICVIPNLVNYLKNHNCKKFY